MCAASCGRAALAYLSLMALSSVPTAGAAFAATTSNPTNRWAATTWTHTSQVNSDEPLAVPSSTRRAGRSPPTPAATAAPRPTAPATLTAPRASPAASWAPTRPHPNRRHAQRHHRVPAEHHEHDGHERARRDHRRSSGSRPRRRRAAPVRLRDAAHRRRRWPATAAPTTGHIYMDGPARSGTASAQRRLLHRGPTGTLNDGAWHMAVGQRVPAA